MVARVTAALPRFGIDAYGDLLGRLRDSGYRLAPVTALTESSDERVALLRHDVDLDPPSTIAMAEREAELQAVATYYVPLTQHFNALATVNRTAIRQLAGLGHEIGLHYDMRTYPVERERALDHLRWEVAILSELAGGPVRTLCMHQPHRGHPDPFRSLPDLVHPHDPGLQHGLVYVSDSCRAWRDASLLDAFGDDPPPRLMLNTHPELWLDDSIDDPLRYLEDVVLAIGLGRARDAFEDEGLAWRGHATARARA